jgi:hypothetical protein
MDEIINYNNKQIVSIMYKVTSSYSTALSSHGSVSPTAFLQVMNKNCTF